MIRNYFIIAWRNLLKNKAFSFINIAGLAIGIATCFIIMLFVADEISFDRFNNKADRIVRISFKATINGGKISESNVMPPVAATLKNDYPEVENAVRLKQDGRPKIGYGQKIFKEANTAFVDPDFFQVFSFLFVQGNPQTALIQPNSMVISQSTAKTIFGSEDPLGKTVVYNKEGQFTITGVMKDMPTNSHFHFDMLGSMASINDSRETSWMKSNYYTYVLLKKGADYKKLEAKLPAMVEKYMGPEILQQMGMSLVQFRTKGNELGFSLQPLTAIHLHPESTSEMEPGGDIKYVYIFGAIALFMLLIAAINFINLSTAGASKRAKEVGVRKVMGSNKFDLVWQFLLESLLVALIAVIVAAVLVQLALPGFNALSGKNLQMGFRVQPIAAMIALGLAVGLLAGAYPALYLSSFKPIATLKGKFQAGTRRFGLRSSLVVIQFFISVSLITATIVVYQQMKFIQQTKLGYNKEQVLVIPDSWALGKNEQRLRDDLLKDSRVSNVTISGFKPAGYSFKNNALAYPLGKDNQVMSAIEYHVDERYLPTLGIELAAGRNFSTSFATDSSAMLINESAARVFGCGDHAVGQKIVRQNSHRGNNYVFTVIGVVKDFHFRSLHEAITPLMMVLDPETGLIIKVKTPQIASFIASLQQKWASYQTEEPFSYAFMDDLYNKQYSAEKKTGMVLSIFAWLTIFVACMGLFGLATYTAEQRAKEIGIRKVLGASVSQVTRMLSKDFLQLVLLGCLAAFPLSWWAMHRWLQDFAYRIELRWWYFVAAGLAALLVALCTVSLKAIKAGLTNPVTSLRAE